MTAHKRSLGQGNVFTPVWDSVHRGGVSAPLHAGIHLAIGRPAPRQAHTHSSPLGRYPLSWHTHPPSPADTTGYGQQTGGTHPTGMHTCLL